MASILLDVAVEHLAPISAQKLLLSFLLVIMESIYVMTGKEIWLDGEWVAWDEANVHVLTHTLHYGLGVFEGIRCYAGDDGRSAVFRLPEHVKRLYDSAKINLLERATGKNIILMGLPGAFTPT